MLKGKIIILIKNYNTNFQYLYAMGILASKFSSVSKAKLSSCSALCASAPPKVTSEPSELHVLQYNENPPSMIYDCSELPPLKAFVPLTRAIDRMNVATQCCTPSIIHLDSSPQLNKVIVEQDPDEEIDRVPSDDLESYTPINVIKSESETSELLCAPFAVQIIEELSGIIDNSSYNELGPGDSENGGAKNKEICANGICRARTTEWKKVCRTCGRNQDGVELVKGECGHLFYAGFSKECTLCPACQIQATPSQDSDLQP